MPSLYPHTRFCPVNWNKLAGLSIDINDWDRTSQEQEVRIWQSLGDTFHPDGVMPS